MSAQDAPLEHPMEAEHRRLIAQRANGSVKADGGVPMKFPLILAEYTVATVPNAAEWERGIIYVSDETGGATLAFSDGSDWRRVQDRAVVS